MSDDHRPGFSHILISAGVVPVPVGIEYTPYGRRVACCSGDRRLYLVGKRGELIVDDEDSILTRGEADVAAGSGEHENPI